jgi:hypothetical protein
MVLKPGEQNRLTEDEMASQFLHILQDASHQPLLPLVGILTSERRDTWAVIRDKIMEGKTVLISFIHILQMVHVHKEN